MKPSILILCTLILSVVGCSKKNNVATSVVKGCTDPNAFNYDSSATEDDGSCKLIAGCLGYTSGLSNSGTLGNTLGNAQNDQFMSGEVDNQRSFWQGVDATVYILYEDRQEDKNAYATPDGNILFGYDMFYYLVQQFSQLSDSTSTPLPVDGVLAHEWGHRVQFTLGWSDYSQPDFKELEADFFSGYYLGLAKQWYWSQIQSYYNTIYSFGDYDYSSPQHHGTPQQRLNAAYAGLQTAVYELNNNVHYTYDQLHQIFNSKLPTDIATGTGRNLKEVSYPSTLNRRQIERLYPHR
jgi:hypothetical protein